MTRTPLVLGSMLVLAGVAAADPKPADPKDDGVTERARLEIQPPGKALKELAIDNPLGDVRVEGYDGTALQIETRKHAPTPEALDRLRISLVPSADGTVRISTTADGGREVAPLARGAVHVDLVIRAPRNVRVDASASAGTLEVVNMDAGGELDTASGAITVRNMSGELLTHSLSGSTRLAQVFGSVDAQTLASELSLDTIAGERLVASTNRGAITGRRLRSRSIELTSTDGPIVIEAEVALHGRLVVANVHGDVDVKVRRHGATLVRARGTKLELGTLAAQARAVADGWLAVATAGDGEPAAVELSSRAGTVRFAFVQ